MTDVAAVLDRALSLGEAGLWDEMAAELAGALEDEPDDAYLLCWLGVAEREVGNDGAAYEAFRRCVAQDPADPHLLALAGAGLAAFDDPDAERVLRAAALTGPDVALARIQYGAYLARAGLHTEALEHLREAVRLAPDDPVAYGELGTALALMGDLGAAAAAMEEAIVLAPDDSWTRFLLGLVRIEDRDLEGGAEALLAAAADRIEDPEAQMLAALAASSAGWDDRAEEAFARVAHSPEPLDPALHAEVDAAITAGSDAARALLLEDLVPSVLRERLIQPI